MTQTSALRLHQQFFITGIMDESTIFGIIDCLFCPECCILYIGSGGGHGFCITKVLRPLGRRFREVF